MWNLSALWSLLKYQLRSELFNLVDVILNWFSSLVTLIKLLSCYDRFACILKALSLKSIICVCFRVTVFLQCLGWGFKFQKIKEAFSRNFISHGIPVPYWESGVPFQGALSVHTGHQPGLLNVVVALYKLIASWSVPNAPSQALLWEITNNGGKAQGRGGGRATLLVIFLPRHIFIEFQRFRGTWFAKTTGIGGKLWPSLKVCLFSPLSTKKN